jgi:hypothetical protein
MSDNERYEIAKAYVDKQLKNMEKNGLEVMKISEHEYETMVKQVAEALGVPSESGAVSSTSQT